MWPIEGYVWSGVFSEAILFKKQTEKFTNDPSLVIFSFKRCTIFLKAKASGHFLKNTKFGANSNFWSPLNTPAQIKEFRFQINPSPFAKHSQMLLLFMLMLAGLFIKQSAVLSRMSRKCRQYRKTRLEEKSGINN